MCDAADEESERPDVRIRWLPFMLNPNIPVEGVDRKQYYRAKFGPDAMIERMTAHLVQAGKEDGINFAFGERLPNTMLGHRILAYTEHQYPNDWVKQDKLSRILFHKYFEQGLDVGSPQILTDAATEAGVALPDGFFQSDRELRFVVEQDTFAKSELDVSGVPYFIFSTPGKEAKYSVSGAQPPSVFIRILGKLLGRLK